MNRKATSFLSAIVLLLITATSFQVSASENLSTHIFKTTGNCYTCLLTIEEAGNSVAGVVETKWDVGLDQTEVTYDNTLTDLFHIMAAIALSGYDTEWYPADEGAYQHLIGTCCEYVHEIDYSNVQVGYLSIMNIWLTPLQLQHVGIENLFSYYPNPCSGTLHFSSQATIDNSSAHVYNMLGDEVLAEDIGVSESIDLSNLPNGKYLIVLKDAEGALVARNQIVKL